MGMENLWLNGFCFCEDYWLIMIDVEFVVVVI